MMREILFKAKRIDNGKWVYGNYAFTDTNGEQHFIFQNKAFEFEVDKDTICQHTGLTDKNGNEVWENDIVSFTHSKLKNITCDNDFGIPTFHTVEYKRNYVIEFVNTYCTYGLRFRNGSIHFPCKRATLRMHDVEVIGNIFDNPELLKAGE